MDHGDECLVPERALAAHFPDRLHMLVLRPLSAAALHPLLRAHVRGGVAATAAGLLILRRAAAPSGTVTTAGTVAAIPRRLGCS